QVAHGGIDKHSQLGGEQTSARCRRDLPSNCVVLKISARPLQRAELASPCFSARDKSAAYSVPSKPRSQLVERHVNTVIPQHPAQHCEGLLLAAEGCTCAFFQPEGRQRPVPIDFKADFGEPSLGKTVVNPLMKWIAVWQRANPLHSGPLRGFRRTG